MNFTNTIKEHEENMYDTEEYRKAFMNYVTRGIAIPEKFTNTNANTKTTDVGAVISPTVINQIIEKMETIGMIVPLVTKTAYPAGADDSDVECKTGCNLGYRRWNIGQTEEDDGAD